MFIFDISYWENPTLNKTKVNEFLSSVIATIVFLSDSDEQLGGHQ